MVGSGCVVQDCNNRSNRAVGIGSHSPSAKTRDVWLRFVRSKRKNFNPKPGTKFVIRSVHFEEYCFTWPFHQSQRRQVKRRSLPSIWKKDAEKPKKTCQNVRVGKKSPHEGEGKAKGKRAKCVNFPLLLF